MNRTMKKLFFIFSLLFSLSISSFLFAQSEEQIKRFEEEKVAFFNRELQLTDSEAEKFWPIYNDFYNRKMRIGEDEKNLLRYFEKNRDNINDQEISDLLAKYIDINDRKNQLEKEYHNEFKKILPDKKVMMLYVVDRQFRMHLIRQIRHSGQGQDPGMEERMKRRGSGSGYKNPEIIPPPFYD